jgi:hypothetical protein
MSFTTDRLTVAVKGVYLINLWMQVKSFPSGTAKLAIRHRINGTGAFSSRKPTARSNGAGDTDIINGFGIFTLNAGDYVQLYAASDTTGNYVIHDVNTTLQLLRQTT